MDSISKYEFANLMNGILYHINSKDLRKLKASQFKEGDVINVSKYCIHIKYGNFDTPALCSWVEDIDFNKIDCTPGSSKGFTPYYIDDFKSR